MGDLKAGPALTRVSCHNYRIVEANLLAGGNETTESRQLLDTVFTDPELGRVGHSKRPAREQGRHIRIAKTPMSHVARALEMDETRSMIKAVVDADSGQILAATLLGVHGGEIMTTIQIATVGGPPYPALRDAMLAHPGVGESLNSLFASFVT